MKTPQWLVTSVLGLIMLPEVAAGAPMKIVTEPFGPMASYGAGAIYVSCSFDGHLDDCLIDTGADTSHIRLDAFSQNYPIIGHTTGVGLSGQPTTCDFIAVSQFIVGGTSLGRQEIVRCDSTPDSDPSIMQESVVGLSSLSGGAIHMDFAAKTLTLDEPLPLGWKSNPLNVYPKLGHFGFEIQISGRPANSIVDTGAALTTIDQNFIQSHPEGFTFIQAIPGGVDADGHPISLKLYQLKTISLPGGITLSGSYAVGSDFSAISMFIPGVSVILGFNAISQKNWYFDLGRKIWAAR